MASPFLDTLLEGCGGSGIYYGSVLLSILIHNDGCLSWGHRIVASLKSALFSSLEMCMCEKEINGTYHRVVLWFKLGCTLLVPQLFYCCGM